MTINSTTTYFQIRGFGRVTGSTSIGSLISQASAGLDADEMRLGVGNYTLFENWEGATVYVVSGDQSRIKTGYYTLLEVDSASGRITIKGDGIAASYATTGPFTNWSVRIEDFIKFFQGDLPQFVSGYRARDNWLPYLLSTTDTLSQKLDPPGGIVTIDGFTLRCMYKTGDPIIEQLFRQVPVPILGNTTGLPVYLTDDDISVSSTTLLVDDEPVPQSIAADPSFDNWPVMVNGESMIIESTSSGGTTLNLLRGVLKTNRVWQSYATIVVDKISSAQGSLLEFFEISSYARCYNPDPDVAGVASNVGGAQSLYFGYIDNLNMDDGLTTFDIETSSVLIKSLLSSAAATMTNIVVGPSSLGPPLEYDVTTRQTLQYIDETLGFQQGAINVKQRIKSKTWNWVKLGDVALRIGRNRINQEITVDNSAIVPQDPSYIVKYPVNDLFRYQATGFLFTENPYDFRQHMVSLAQNKPDDYGRKFVYWPNNNENIEPWIRTKEKTYALDVFSTSEAIAWESPAFLTGLFSEGPAVKRGDDIKAPELCHVFEMGGNLYNPDSPPVSSLAAISDSIDLIPENAANIYDSVGTDSVLNKKSAYLYVPVIDIRDLVLQVLTSTTGKGLNKVTFKIWNTTTLKYDDIEQTFDYLPDGVGLGIPGDLIDTSTLFFMRNPQETRSRLPGDYDSNNSIQIANVYITQEDSADILSWLTKKILEPYGFAIVQTESGKLGLASFTSNYLEGFPSIGTDDLVIDSNKILPNVPQTYDGSKIISSILHSIQVPYVTGIDNIIVKTILKESLSEEGRPALTYGIYNSINNSGKKIKYEKLPYVPAEKVLIYAGAILNYFSRQSTSIQLRLRDEDLYKQFDYIYGVNPGNKILKKIVKRTVGSLIELDIDNLINVNGSRGGKQYGFITSIKRDFQTKTSIISVILLSGRILTNYEKYLTASGIVAAGATSTVIPLVPGYYTQAADDILGFEAGDIVNLYDENFVLLSTSISGVIGSLSSNQITMSTEFEDASGVITPPAGSIIKHARVTIQPDSPLVRINYLANFNIKAREEDPGPPIKNLSTEYA